MLPLNQKGMFLETVLNLTHQKYNQEKICSVFKIPVNQIYSSSRKQNFFLQHNFCDYVSNYQGWYFEFEAKETYNDYFCLNPN